MDFEAFMEKFPIKLNRQQREAVQATEGPVLLLAVPGSGKTTVLVTRLGYMIMAKNISSSNILTLTYTVSATNDMKERFISLFGENVERPKFKTINSLCNSIIKFYGDQIGKEAYRLENDEKVLLSIISSLYLKYENTYPTEGDLKSIKTYFTYIKNKMLTEEEIRKLEKEADCHLLSIYQGYCEELKNRSCMDFDDQMVYAYRLLKLVPWLLEYYQNLYPYICVDEAQDTSKIQHEIIRLLASGSKNLFMVGDEDQSIYGFRAAYPKALLKFEKEYKNAKVLYMEENFRSNANIVKAADEFIKKNTLRHKKNMRPVRQAGSQIEEITLKNRKEQYLFLKIVAERCEENTAVLYRDNESAVPLVDLLDRHGISYQIRNRELSFFTNRVVTDIITIIRFSMDMKDTSLFEMIYYKMATYLSKEMALKACEISKEYHISIFTAIFGYLELKPNHRKSLKLLETNLSQLNHLNPSRAINRILMQIGYQNYMERNNLDDSKIFILNQIASGEETVAGFLRRMDELKEIFREKINDQKNHFILSTIHGSKGLEYDTVYLIDILDGIFPEEVPKETGRIKQEEVESYEEERRLFYVGITRARQNLYLFRLQESSAFLDQLLGKKEICLPQNMAKIERRRKESKEEKITSPYSGKKGMERGLENSFLEEEYREFVSHLRVGSRVIHRKIGEGRVTGLKGTSITILFDSYEKTFNLKVLFLNQLLLEE